MNWHIVFGVIAPLIAIAGYIPYIVNILRGHTKPHAFSWFIWGTLTAIICAAQISSGAGAGAWATGVTAAINLIIAGLALKYGYRDIHRADWLALGAALLSVPLWVVTKDPFWSVALSTFIIAMGYIPTFRKSWVAPHSETALTFALTASKTFFSLLALETVSPSTALYPLCMTLTDVILCALILWRRKAIQAKASI